MTTHHMRTHTHTHTHTHIHTHTDTHTHTHLLRPLQGFDIILNGLDNLEARRHVNRLAMAADVPLVESGTAGYLGQVCWLRTYTRMRYFAFLLVSVALLLTRFSSACTKRFWDWPSCCVCLVVKSSAAADSYAFCVCALACALAWLRFLGVLHALVCCLEYNYWEYCVPMGLGLAPLCVSAACTCALARFYFTRMLRAHGPWHSKD